MQISDSTYDGRIQNIASDNQGGAFIAYRWEVSNPNNDDLFVNYVKSDGTKDFGTYGYELNAQGGGASYINFTQVLQNGSNGIVAVWQEIVPADSKGDIFAQSISSVTPPVTVTNVNPSYGPTAGGTAVTITGTEFVNVTDVTFGGVSCTSIVTVNDTTITCDTPAHLVEESVNVTVYTTAEPAGVTLAGGFTYTNDICGPMGPNEQCGVLELTGTTDIFFSGYDPAGGVEIPKVFFKSGDTSASGQESSLDITADAWSENQFIGIIDLEDGNTWTLQVRGPASFTGTGANAFTPDLIEAATSPHEFDSGAFSLTLTDLNATPFVMSKDASSGTESNNLIYWVDGNSGYSWANGNVTAPLNLADAVTWDSTAFSASIATDEDILVNSTDDGELGIFGTGINFNVGIPGGTGADTYTGTITYTLI